ncbi:aminotransferase class I/II-fold pyridoxal phosphate-dependent enzyme [Variovorax fucosicus]|uniref:aminotransferase class I/II-fold pyridoxal phosphate-dependent enzyme n=1 Tax=Variovorax fucosicus TaxID=3053517 RepID=UPI0025763896|nr:aminotransferase class I/II-fold pyridoxal phosphate-dependent enzyme [Variovorax sp. J22G47]MDM0057261.1 aminotransferase class I/II-fold pyridoxal phosphate-dependent enzyme [Variovorax sp. J22G47]
MTFLPNPSDADLRDSHGGPDAQGVPLHDFSTNSNACGPCPAILEAVRQADATRYPDPRYGGLRARLAEFHGVAAERIVFAASASELIFRLTAAAARRGARSVCLPAHGYGDYARAAQAWGLQPAPQVEARLVWCCDPSSPLGQAQSGLPASIDALAADAVCVLDLAYEPLRLDGALGLGSAQRDRVWQLWTPNKALGLTGVRAAYAIAPVDAGDWVDTVDAMAPSWPVGTHGVALLDGWTSAATQQWLATSLVTLREWKARQIVLCEQEFGWRCLPGAANFFCARPPMDDIAGLCAGLRTQGIKLRDTTSFGLPGHVRLAALPPASGQALADALRRIGKAPTTIPE